MATSYHGCINAPEITTVSSNAFLDGGASAVFGENQHQQLQRQSQSKPRKIGDGAVGVSTTKGRSAGNEHWNNFIRKYKYKRDEASLCSVELFQRFAGYMLDEASNRASKSGKNVTVGTAVDYVGIAKESTRKEFPNNPIWVGHDSEKNGKNNSGGWYTKIRAEMHKTSLLAAIEKVI